jgi:hypothetical protein
VPIAFDSKEDVAFALASEAYRDAAQLRKAFMQVTSRGILLARCYLQARNRRSDRRANKGESI